MPDDTNAPAAPAPDPVAVLAALEAPKHRRDMAGVMVGRKRLLHALGAATQEDIDAAVAEHEAARQAHAAHMAAIDPRAIDVAAQAVIDARNEKDADNAAG